MSATSQRKSYTFKEGLTMMAARAVGIDPYLAAEAGEGAKAAINAIRHASKAKNPKDRAALIRQAQTELRSINAAKHSKVVNAIQARLLALQGRGGDTEIAHLTPGEVVLPRSLQTPQLMQQIAAMAARQGIDPRQLTVGNRANKVNPRTGQKEFLDDVTVIARPNTYTGGGGGVDLGIRGGYSFGTGGVEGMIEYSEDVDPAANEEVPPNLRYLIKQGWKFVAKKDGSKVLLSPDGKEEVLLEVSAKDLSPTHPPFNDPTVGLYSIPYVPPDSGVDPAVFTGTTAFYPPSLRWLFETADTTDLEKWNSRLEFIKTINDIREMWVALMEAAVEMGISKHFFKSATPGGVAGLSIHMLVTWISSMQSTIESVLDERSKAGTNPR